MNRELFFCCGMSAASDDDPLVAPTPVPDARFFTFACAAAGQCVQLALPNWSAYSPGGHCSHTDPAVGAK